MPMNREEAKKAVEDMRKTCRDIYSDVFHDAEFPQPLNDIYTKTFELDGHIDRVLPEPAKDATAAGA